MKLIKTIGNCCLVFLCVISICVSIAYAYYHFFVHEETIGVNNISDQIGLDVVSADELTEEEKDEYEERWFMEANYYSNDKNNGVELQELKYNYFTGYDLTSDQYRSTGMQYLGDYQSSDHAVASVEEVGKIYSTAFYYYDTTNGISWSGFNGKASVSTVLNRDQKLIIKIDDRPFSIQLTGKYDTYSKFLWWTYVSSTTYYSYSTVFVSVFNAIESNDHGYGDYYITLDLSQYFSVKEYDTESKKFKEDDVTDIIKNYAVLKFHYDENGARNSSQSLFGSIACNPSYDTSDEKVDTTYWQERMVYDLDYTSKLNGNELFTYRYSEVYDGYFLSLSMDGKKLFANMPRAKVNVVIDLSDISSVKGYKVVGLDYDAFNGVELDTLTIKGKTQIFYFLDNALKDTQLQTLMHSSKVTLNGLENAIDSEYAEVKL